ncbi:MAG: DNA-directed RNA polymerase subunit omega [Actinomycetota bacterium]
MIEPAAERLLEKVDNQYTLVVVAARRARQIVDYYTKLGAGLEEKPLPPLLGTVHGMKPLAISLREIEEEKIGYERPAEVEESVK